MEHHKQQQDPVMSEFDISGLDLWQSSDSIVIPDSYTDKVKRDRPQPNAQEVSELERSYKSQKTEMSPVVHSNFTLPALINPISSSTNSNDNNNVNQGHPFKDVFNQKQDPELNKNASNQNDNINKLDPTSSVVLTIDNYQDADDKDISDADDCNDDDDDEDDDDEYSESNNESDTKNYHKSQHHQTISDSEGNQASSSAPWSLEEDATLVETQAQVGNKWLYISQLLPGRTKAHCKVRFTSLFRASKKEWTSDNDILLLELLEKYKGDFKRMAEHFPMRTKNAVKLRTRELQRIRKNKGKIKVPPVGSPKQLFFHRRDFLLKYFMHTGTHQCYPANMDPPAKDAGSENATSAMNALVAGRYIPDYNRQMMHSHDGNATVDNAQAQSNLFISRNNSMLSRSPIERSPMSVPVRTLGDKNDARNRSRSINRSEPYESPVQNQSQMPPPILLSPPAIRQHVEIPSSKPAELSPSDPQTRKTMEMQSPYQNANQLASPMLSELFSRTTLNTPRSSAHQMATTSISSFVEVNPSNPQSNSSTGPTNLPPVPPLPVSDFDVIAAELFCDGGFILDDNQFTNFLGDQ